MVEMISYIFGSLRTSENSLKQINMALRKQAKFNRAVTTFALVTAVYAITVELYSLEQNKKIEKLSNEIKELKREKGE